MLKPFSLLLLLIIFTLELSAQKNGADKKDTIYITKTDTVYKFKHDTITVLRYVRDTVYRSNRELTKIKSKAIAAPIKNINSLSAYKVNDKVLVVWNSDWYPATILEVKDQQYKITYDGFSSSWDEWVTVDRIKRRE